MNTVFLYCAAVTLVVAFLLVRPVAKEATLPGKRRQVLYLILGGGTVLGSLGLYFLLGAGQWIDPIETQRHNQHILREEIVQLTAATQKNPSDTQSWQKLGSAWIEAQNPAQAAGALRHAVLSSGGNPDLIAQYAAALIVQNNGVVNEDALASIAMALKLNPEQPLARELESLWHKQQSKGSEDRD